ncbi:hypothetical protein FGO68_gene2300 [Halteria grandinella]|uniref:Uncharacterized protein n=1 Tax=Halteria grandinella TaxID=5974 RepID=A0A8J8NIG9_HALGN|nr:hypothetical protein FGO68_gene2300 [Halteria grandinella]
MKAMEGKVSKVTLVEEEKKGAYEKKQKDTFIKEARLLGQKVQRLEDGADIKESLLEIDLQVSKTSNILPKVIKHIICVPPVSIEIISKATSFRESLGLLDEQIFTQFQKDVLKASLNVSKYENEVRLDSDWQIHYLVRVWYKEKDQKEYKYTFERVGMLEPNGKFKIKEIL